MKEIKHLRSYKILSVNNHFLSRDNFGIIKKLKKSQVIRTRYRKILGQQQEKKNDFIVSL